MEVTQIQNLGEAYAILSGKYGNVLLDPYLIEIAVQLSKEGILNMKREAQGFRISIEIGSTIKRSCGFKKKGVIEHINKLFETWGLVYENRELYYDIRNNYCKEHVISGTIFYPYTPFQISVCSALKPRSCDVASPQKEAWTFAFKDLYCNRLSFQDINTHLKYHTDCVLAYKNDSFLLNGPTITHKGTIRHLLLMVLVQHHLTSCKIGSSLPLLTFKQAFTITSKEFHEHLENPGKQFSRALADLRRTVMALGFPEDLLIESFQENHATFFRLMPHIIPRVSP